MILVGTKIQGGADETVVSTVTVKASTADKLVKALRDGRGDNHAFTIRKDNDEVVAFADLTDPAGRFAEAAHSVYNVFIGGQFVRKIPRKDVVGTVRLYADAQRLRGLLAKAPAMVVTPEAA